MNSFDTRYRVYLGHEIKGGGSVNVDVAVGIVADRFPDGFTVYNAHGAWKRGADTIRERSSVFEILGTQGDATKVRALALALKTAFRQDSVLVTADSLPVVVFV